MGKNSHDGKNLNNSEEVLEMARSRSLMLYIDTAWKIWEEYDNLVQMIPHEVLLENTNVLIEGND